MPSYKYFLTIDKKRGCIAPLFLSIVMNVRAFIQRSEHF